MIFVQNHGCCATAMSGWQRSHSATMANVTRPPAASAASSFLLTTPGGVARTSHARSSMRSAVLIAKGLIQPFETSMQHHSRRDRGHAALAGRLLDGKALQLHVLDETS